MANHFRHGVKISLPFYLYTSLTKNIEGYKKNPVKNPALHEGLLLLVYEFLKTLTIGRTIVNPNSDSEESASSDSEDALVVNIEEAVSSSKVVSGSCNPCNPSRKSPRSLPPNPPIP